MYRLLIVTGNPSVKEMLTAMEGWEKMGFKPPRLFDTAEEAMEGLRSFKVDAIAVEDSPAFDALMTCLDEQYPFKPLFQLAPSEEEQRKVLQELYSLLTRLSADDTDDAYDDGYKLQLQRDRWLRKVVCGMVPTKEDLARQLRLYRCREQVDVPCVLARLELPDDDGFLSNRWHYGSERLETALRNFFGYEREHMLMHVAVISQQEVRILCYPASADHGVSENAAFEYIQETIDQIDHYLGLRMKVLEVHRVPGLCAFTAG